MYISKIKTKVYINKDNYHISASSVAVFGGVKTVPLFSTKIKLKSVIKYICFGVRDYM